MKKSLLSKFWLLLLCLVAGVNSAWAETKSVTISPSQALNDGGVDPITIILSKGDGTSNPAISSGQLRLYQAASGKTTGNTMVFSSEKTITSIVFTFANNMTATNGVFSVGSYDSSTSTWSGSTNSVMLTVTGTKSGERIYITEMIVYYEEEGGSSTLDDSDLALTGAPIALSFDLYNNSDAQVISYTTSSTGAVTVSESEYFDAVVDKSAKTITITPLIVTPEVQTVTVSQEADENYDAGNVTFTISIDDSTPVPTHTATFSVNGITSTQDFAEGAAIVFPSNPGDINGKTFVGWATTTITGTTDEAPEFVTSATMGDADITYYAVFATVDEGGAGLVKMVSGDSFTDGDKIVIVAVVDDNTSYALYQETVSNSYVQYYSFPNDYTVSNDKNWLTVNAGQNGKWKLGDATNGYLYNNSSNNLSVDTSNSTDWALEDNEDGTFKLKGARYLSCRSDLSGDNQYRFRMAGSTPSGIYSFDIYKLSGGTSYSGYCTTVEADTRQEAGISFEEETVTVEIVENYTGQALANPKNVSPIEWTSSNEDVATVVDGTVTVKAVGETTITASFAGDETYKKAMASYTLTIQDSRIALDLSFEETTIEINVNEAVAAPTLNGNTGGGAVTYTSSDTNIATVDPSTGEVTGVADGTATITATVAEVTGYHGGTATFTVTVIDPNKKGSQNNPYTVAEAREAIDAGTGVTGVYAKGIVSEIVEEYSSTYHNISYNISADGTTEADQLEAFRGKSFDGENFNSADEIKVGDEVIIYGNLTKYKSTYEFNSNNQLVSRKRIKISEAQYATYASEYTRDFSGSGLTVYTAKYNSDRGTATLNKVEDGKVPANTAVILYAETAGDYIASVIASAKALENNDLQVSDGTVTGGAEIYCLAKKNENVGFYNVAPEVTVPAGKAYLVAEGANAREFISFLEDETTGISLLENKKQMENCYNLNGQRVAAPAKGLYIVNGKKIVIK